MQIETYNGMYDDDIISLILTIQNTEAKINLSLQEQPDLLNIKQAYQQNGGNFWIARSNNEIIGMIGYIYPDRNSILYVLDL